MSSFAGELAEAAGVETETQDTEAEVTPTETGEEAAEATEGNGDTPEPDPTDKRVQGLETALSETRKRAQAAERELAFVQGRISQLGGNAETQELDDPGIDEDQLWSNPIEAIDKIVDSKLTKARAADLERHAAKCQRRARKQWDDYDTVEASFLEAAESNKALAVEAFNADDPAEFAYKWIKERETVKSLDGKSVDEIKAALREEILAELKGSDGKPTPPKTQAGARNAGTTGGVVVDDDPFSGPGRL